MENRGKYVFEHAKSSRASCKKCKEKIEKDVLRFGSSYVSGDHDVMSWFHFPACVSKKVAGNILAAKADPANSRSIEFGEGIAEAAQAKMLADVEALSQAAQAASGGEGDGDAAGKAKRAKKALPAYADVSWTDANLRKLSADTLKVYLRQHKLALSGSKAELVSRVQQHLSGGGGPSASGGNQQVAGHDDDGDDEAAGEDDDDAE